MYADVLWVSDDTADVERLCIVILDDTSDHAPVKTGITVPELDVAIPGGTAYLTAEDLTSADEGEHVFVYETAPGTRWQTGVPLIATVRYTHSATPFEHRVVIGKDKL